MAELQLDALESKGLIRLAAIDPELEYLFRHALVQDAAYESLLKQERRALHRQVGEALEAARFANDRNAVSEAHALYGRAWELLPPATDDDPPELRRTRLEVGFGRIRSGFSFLAWEEQLEQLAPIIDEAERLGDLRLIADVRMHDALLRMYHGERPKASAALEANFARVAEIARELDDPVISALPRSVVGLFQVFTGDLREGVAALEEAAPLLEQKHDFVGSSFALMALGMGLARLGRFDEAERASERSVAVAEAGDVIARIDALIGRSAIETIRGDFEAAAPLAQECSRLAEESGAAACVVTSAYFAGDALLQQKRFGDARIEFERSLTVSDLTNDQMFRPVVTASMHSVTASLGQPQLVGRSFDETLAQTRRNHDKWAETNVLWKRADTESNKADGDRDQMNSDYASAVDGFREMGARPFEARALRDWGNALRAMGRIDESNEKLRAALPLLDELGITREADEVRSALES
jgi:tetratricopeptide (TPR) repeat protein